jgi:hypothetical protein
VGSNPTLSAINFKYLDTKNRTEAGQKEAEGLWFLYPLFFCRKLPLKGDTP